MRKPFIAGNWKMNTNLAEGLALVRAMLDDLQKVEDIDRVLCPPFITLQAAGDLVAGTSIQMGAQNTYFKESGAFTGEVSPRMLAGLCKYVILGHSERRQYFGETDAVVNAKVRAVLAAGLLPIFCIGETLEQNEAGKTEDILSRQVREGLKDIAADRAIVVAYEPIWAIDHKATGRRQAGNSAIRVQHTRGEIAGEVHPYEACNCRCIAEFVRTEIDGARWAAPA
jgi:triosephosphate isomerase